jgi:hypothetical protein
VYDLAIDATHVYWTSWDAANPASPGSVAKVPLYGGVATTLASNLPEPMFIALGATAVFWTCPSSISTGIMMVPMTGGAPTLLASSDAPGGVACDGRNVYWTSESATPYGSSPLIDSIPVAGGSPKSLLSSFFANPLGGIAVDATSIYVAAGEEYTSVVVSLPLGGGSITTLASYQSASSVAVDSANVYWINWTPTSGSVCSVPLAGGSVTTLADNPDGPSSIATDGANVYWTNSNGGTVMRIAASGGAPTTLANGLTHPSGIAVDATSVYFGTHDAVMKLTPK